MRVRIPAAAAAGCSRRTAARRSIVAVGAAAFLICGGLLSCAQNPRQPASNTIPESASDAQRAILEEVPIGADQYREAFENYRMCLQEYGFSPGDPVLNPMDSRRLLMDIAPPDGNEQADPHRTGCDEREYQEVFRVYRENEPDELASDLLADVMPTLLADGIALSGEERSLSEIFGSDLDDEDRRQRIVRVLTEAATRLYPDLPFLVIGY